jgi:hypothetical protein
MEDAMDRDDQGSHVDRPILERRRIGTVLRVTAIDPATGMEVVIQGPTTHGPRALEHLALRKLAWALNRAADRERNAS